MMFVPKRNSADATPGPCAAIQNVTAGSYCNLGKHIRSAALEALSDYEVGEVGIFKGWPRGNTSSVAIDFTQDLTLGHSSAHLEGCWGAFEDEMSSARGQLGCYSATKVLDAFPSLRLKEAAFCNYCWAHGFAQHPTEEGCIEISAARQELAVLKQKKALKNKAT